MINKFIIFTFLSISILFLNGCEQKVQTPTETNTKEAKTKIQEEFIEIGQFSDGAKLYNEELRKDCKISGYSLARKKSKEQWEEIAKNGKFAETIKEICPEVTFNNIWTPDIYEYLYKNAISSILLHSK